MTIPKFSELSKSVQMVVSVGVVATALVAISVPAVWALDTRYVTVGSVEQAFLVRDIRDLKRLIRKLEFLRATNEITEAQTWELDGLQGELEELKDEQNK